MYTIEDVANYVEQEGLGYSIESGLHGPDIKNRELRKLWMEAEKTLARISEILYDHV